MPLPFLSPNSAPRSFIRGILQKLLWEDPTPDQNFSGHYLRWRANRIAAIVRHYGPAWFAGKNLLELGAGFGHIGSYFSKLGANVTCIDGRPENVEIMKRRYPHLRGVVADLDAQLPIDRPYDIVLHLGLLYHLSKPEESLRLVCAAAPHLVFETEVSDSTDPYYVVHHDEDAAQFDQSLSGRGSRPSPAYVERIFADCRLQFSRLEDGVLDTFYSEHEDCIPHLYSWPVTNTGRSAPGWRKFWFAKKSSPTAET